MASAAGEVDCSYNEEPRAERMREQTQERCPGVLPGKAHRLCAGAPAIERTRGPAVRRLPPIGARTAALVILLALAACADSSSPAEPVGPVEPPFGGTIFFGPDIITGADPTTFEGLTYSGQAERTMYDRRVPGWITVDAYLFAASYDDGLAAEVQVNPEFGDVEAARALALRFADVIGRLPTALRVDVDAIWIHAGVQPFGGGNRSLLIHLGQADAYDADGILEETFVHEAAHTSLDAAHATSPGWVAAQKADPVFISTYARDNPTREDIAESFLPWLAVRYRSSRVSTFFVDRIVAAIPHRLDYFDGLNLDMYPIVGPAPAR